MTTVQKIIKYLAIALAIFIIINIVSAVVFGFYLFGSALGLTKKANKAEIASGEIISTELENTNVTTLDISLKYSSLEIKKGDKILVESNNEDINCKQIGNKIIIKEKDNRWFSENDKNKLTIYIPENLKFETVKIETGAGEITIDKVTTEKLNLEIGAGKVEIKDLNVKDTAKIDGGAGKVDILSGEIHNLDLDMGVGTFEMSTKLTGNNKIDAGIGKLVIKLLDEKENYSIKAEKGIGTIKMNGKEIGNDVNYGNGTNIIDIDGRSR